MSIEPCAPTAALVFREEAPTDGPAVEALLDEAFGPGRFVKSSERVREFAAFAPELTICAFLDGRLAGVPYPIIPGHVNCGRVLDHRSGSRPSNRNGQTDRIEWQS